MSTHPAAVPALFASIPGNPFLAPRALRTAVAIDPRTADRIPSTKGTLGG